MKEEFSTLEAGRDFKKFKKAMDKKYKMKKRKKVYCKNCKYYRHNMRIGSDIPEKDWREWDECHSKNRIYEINPIQKIDVTHPNTKNKNNDCKDFKRKK